MQARQAPRMTSLVADLVVFPQAAVEDVGSRGCCVGTFFELVHRASAIGTQWQRINDRDHPFLVGGLLLTQRFDVWEIMLNQKQ